MNSLPGGDRHGPPPRVKAALATDSPGNRIVLLCLLDEEEELVLGHVFKYRDWRVVLAGDELDFVTLADQQPPSLVITDDPGFAGTMNDYLRASVPVVIVIVDDRQTAVEGAWNAGADWVLTRPIDPLALSEILRE